MSSPLRFLLALAFALGQCLALAHAAQHELGGGDSQACETCAIAHAGGGAPPVPAFVATILPQIAATAPVLPSAPALRRTLRFKSRAPPDFPG